MKRIFENTKKTSKNNDIKNWITYKMKPRLNIIEANQS